MPGSMYRRRCFFAGYERGARRPFAREGTTKKERTKQEEEREREEKRTRAAMLFLFTHPLYQHSESRLPKVYDATREREDVSRSSRSAASAPREVSEVRASDASAFRY